ncbi:MAG: hypothetical protein GF398_07710 [Chitinivibrionales bacterium]|nr:hypothetical protein [Chitinivibrionales bacterium]
MFQKISDRTKATQHHGFTLVGMLIALVISAFVLAGVTRLFQSSLSSYSKQEQLMEMRRTAQITIDKLTDMFMQAGADLPDTIECIDASGSDDVTLHLNLRGAYQKIRQTATNSQFQIDNARAFIGLEKVNLLRTDGTESQLMLAGLPDTLNDVITFASTVTLDSGDIIYGKNTYRYWHDPSNDKLHVVVDGNDAVLAQNVTDFSVTFLTLDELETTNWDDMKICSLYVAIETAVPLGKGASAKHRTHDESKKFFLRNKV